MKAWLSGWILFLGSCLQLSAQSCPGSLLFNVANPAVDLPSSNQYYTGTNGGYTWECWFQLNQPFGSNVRPLISALDAVLFEDMYLGFGWQGGWFNEPVTNLVFKVDGPNSTFPTGPNCAYAPPGGYLLNTWYHAAGVMNYNTQLATLFLNGVPVDTKTITTPPITRVIPAELSFNWSGTPLPLFGNMDEVRIWNRPLTNLEIFTNYNQCLNGNEQNLIVYYRCGQPGGSTVTDATPNGNTGTFALVPGWSSLDAGLTGTACATQPSTLNVPSTGSVICAGSLATLSAGGALSYTWSTGANSSSIVVAPNVTTSYTVSASVITCSAASIASVVMTVTVNPLPNVVATALNPQICSGSTATLWAFGASGYQWTNGPTTNSITVSPLTTTSYTVYGSPCSMNSIPAVVTVSVNPSPVITAASLNPPVCSGLTVTLSASGAGSYTWSTGDTTSLTVVNPSVTTSYTVYGSLGSCTSQAVATASILPNPIPVVAGATVCLNNALSLYASGGTNYSWNGPSGYSANTATAAIPIVNTAYTGIYSVTVTGPNLCTASATAEVIGYPFILPLTSIKAPAKSCINSTIRLYGDGGSSYVWTGPNNYSSTQQNISLSASSQAVGGIYTLSVKNNSNCTSSGTVLISIYPLPKGMLYSSNNKHCIPFCSALSFSPSAGNTAPIASTSFSIDNGYSNSTGFTTCFKKAGDYKTSVLFTDTNGCSNAAYLTINAYPVPVADFEFSPAKPVEGTEPVKLTNTSTGAGLERWSWFFTDNTGGASYTEHTSHMYEYAGTYPVAMVVTNTWGCSDTIVKPITVDSDFGLYVPNAFTPNGNDLNELFQPKGVGIVKYHLEIFDRWGEKLFSSSDFFKGWDGTYKGVLCKSDTYIWKIDLTDPSGRARHYSGHVSILE